MYIKHIKVPMIMQLEALECGAACLAMILGYHGKWIPLEQIRKDCDVSRDGSNAKNVLCAARSYGLSAKGYRYEPDMLRQKAVLPCIIHWNFSHFVVLKGFKKDKVLLNDPAKGSIAVSADEFNKSFTGICMMFQKTESFQPSGKPKSMLNFAKSRLTGTLGAFILIILTQIATCIINIANPVFSRIFTDRILTNTNPGWLMPLIYFLIASLLAMTAISFIKSIYLLKMQGKLAAAANSQYVWHVLRLPLEFFSQRMTGDIANRQKHNEGIANSLINELAPTVMNMAMIVLYIAVMINSSPLLTAVGLCSITLNMLTARIISNKRMNITRVQMRDKANLAGITVTGIEIIETIKSGGTENGYFDLWAGVQASVAAQNVKYENLNCYLGSIPMLIQKLANVLIIYLSVYMVIMGKYTAGMILAFQGFIAAFMGPVNSMIKTGQNVQEMRTNAERIEDVMNYKTDEAERIKIEISEGSSLNKLKGNIEIKDLTFGYSALKEPLIKNFSLSLKTGSCIAIVGASGCGKSTISKLISGLYKPWSGELTFDGKSLSEISKEIFTGSLSVVDQDIILFEDSIADNIRMWDKSIEDFEIILAARDANIHQDIMQRDGGYNYKVSEGGRDFSGGQRQRLEIARALAQDPSIIILDEATNALDSKTEYEVVKAIKERGITCIIIAHRLSTIRDCDEIIVLNNGLIVERGTHNQLYANGGLYTQLVTNE